MADPISFVAVGKALGVLLSVISKVYKAAGQRGLGQEEVDALETLVKSFGDLAAVLPSREAESQLDTRYRALVLGAFLRAWNQLHESESTVRLARWSIHSDARELHTELIERVRLASSGSSDLNLLDTDATQIGLLSEFLHKPIATRWYRALWDSFTEARVRIDADVAAAPLLDVRDRLLFERYFHLTWLQIIESAAGGPLKAGLLAAGVLRVQLARQLLLADMATWGGRHVFGNETKLSRSDDLSVPFMALEEMYVEPDGELVDGDKRGAFRRAPITSLIESLLRDGTKVIVVVANFGHGKSLTARTLAYRWSRNYLESTQPSPITRMPVFVRCSDCLDGYPDVLRSIRRSNKLRAAQIDESLDLDQDDAIYDPPSPSEESVIIYDGLDEVVWGPDSLKQFFRVLGEKASNRQRFVIFSRPDVIPADHAMRDVTIVRLQPLTRLLGPKAELIENWLERWGRSLPTWIAARREKGLAAAQNPLLTLQAIREANLEELASTPILLFLMAYGYALSGALGASRAALYEDFFWHIAYGKFERDTEKHPRVREASENLANRLKRKGLLDVEAEPPMAMLWLMSRIAWESSCKEWQARLQAIRESPEHSHSVLVRRDVENVLHIELGIRDEHAIQSIQVGMLLALQADLRGDQHHILYGHQSFREFLAARYWTDCLRRVLREPSSRDAIFKSLYSGRLLGDEDKTIDFVGQILKSDVKPRVGSSLGWSKDARDSLARVTWDEFLREEPWFDDNAAANKPLIDNRRPPFREAMLVISNLLHPVTIDDSGSRLSLHSMLGYFWSIHVRSFIRLPGAIISGQLSKLDFFGADLQGAALQNARLGSVDLEGANLQSTNFNGAALTGASLRGADLRRANLVHAELHRTDLHKAKLQYADLRKAELVGAFLHSAILCNADLRGANLQNAEIADADLSEANLERANLLGAILRGARLQKARLYGAVLADADLSGADFQDADLTGANLGRANLVGANLTGVILAGAFCRSAKYSRATRWPEGFDYTGAGACPME